MKRWIFDTILFLGLYILPWWVGVILMFIGIFIYKDFYEFIIAGVIIYSLYIVRAHSFMTSITLSISILLFLYIIIQFLRSKIIFYNNKF